jgi:phosphatidylserine decarboxylase
VKKESVVGERVARIEERIDHAVKLLEAHLSNFAELNRRVSVLEQYKAKLMVIATLVGASCAVLWDYARSRLFGHN